MSKNDPARTPEQEAKEIYALAVDCIKKNDLGGAEKFLVQSMNIAPTPDAAHNLGTLRFMKGQTDQAVALFQQATILNPHYDAAYANLMRIFYQKDDIAKAVEYCAMAITAAPDNRNYKVEFAELLGKKRFVVSNSEIKNLIAFCLEDGTLNYDKIGKAWLSLMAADKELGPIYDLRKHKNFEEFEKDFCELEDYKGLISRYVTLGLRQMTVCDIEFENFLTNLRRILLKDCVKEKNVLFGKDFADLIIALSIYCFYTEYVFKVSEEEEIWLESLRTGINEKGAKSAEIHLMLILACYENIVRRDDAETWANRLSKSEGFEIFARYHLLEPLKEQNLKQQIISVTETLAPTSLKVRDMYEELPYPRWRYKPEQTEKADTAPVTNHLPQGKFKILNAGCGTGREALYLLNTFPESEITAVDLSRTSLAYAIRKTGEKNVGSITFRQADILALENAFKAESFDLITSSGVIHHLETPEDGLAVLVRLLKPGGIMNLAVYSEIARRSVVKARTVIAERKIADDAAGIKYFRQNIESLLPPADVKNLMEFSDYFYLSECKDLLFHVMEHRYTTLQLKDMLARHNLEFMGFRDNKQVLEEYRKTFPKDQNATNLENWHRFEENNPDSFKGMYQFWVRKPLN